MVLQNSRLINRLLFQKVQELNTQVIEFVC